MKKIASGKVREIFDMEDGTLVIVATDRISAFDVILPTTIPGKGQVLTSMSDFWFCNTKNIIKNHEITCCESELPKEFRTAEYAGRTMQVQKLKMLPYEIIVRGYMFGSMYEAYKKDGTFLGITFNKKYQKAQKLDTPIVTPSTKAATGHDINITIEKMKSGIGDTLALQIEKSAIAMYEACAKHALSCGIIIADTKFEFGLNDKGECILADEVLTPDSSRFWDATTYHVGDSPASYDKQFVRDWLKEKGLAGSKDIKEIPSIVVEKTSAKYAECMKKLCTLPF